MLARAIAIALLLLAAALPCPAQAPDLGVDSLYRITPGPTKMVNSLWGENPAERQFGNGRSRVTIADLKGPGIITMIHFALPQAMKMGRDTVLRIWWDGERNPSVQSPLVDFFADPNGALERVDTILVNKKRGWNCYFPMPFAKRARIGLSYDNPRYPGGAWAMNPCYSYVMWRPVKSLPADTGYFHALWNQKAVHLDREEYVALDATGTGQFIGWNITVRGVDSPKDGYFVDENEKFFVDGEKEPSIEWQGLEDSFGFSWGFPPEDNSFPRTGYQKYYNGAAAYRFCIPDRISFRKSLRVTIGFGKNEIKAWRAMFPKGMNTHEFSSVVYWYQNEPHKPFPPMPSARDRRPSGLPMVIGKPRAEGEPLSLRCGHPDGDIEYLADGWDFELKSGYLFSGQPWTSAIKHCWADYKTLAFDITCPKGVAGTLRLYLLDGDNFAGGRKQSVTVDGRLIGVYEGFRAGTWVDVPITAADTAGGRIAVRMQNLKPGSNAVVTYARFELAK